MRNKHDSWRKPRAALVPIDTLGFLHLISYLALITSAKPPVFGAVIIITTHGFITNAAFSHSNASGLPMLRIA